MSVTDQINNAKAESEWNDPEPLVEASIPAQPYPLEALPALLREAVTEVQSFIQSPVSLVAQSAIATLSLAAQGLVDVTRAHHLSGPTGLYMLAVAQSGERKTAGDKYFIKPIEEYEAEAAEAAKPELKAHAAAMQSWNAKKEGTLAAIRQASKEGKDCSKLERALEDIEAEQPEDPRVPQLLLSDITPEAKAWHLAKKWPTAGIFSNEAGIVLGGHAMGKDSLMRNLAFDNTLWDGGSVNIGRKTSESFTVRGARLTTSLMIQPTTLVDAMAKAGPLMRDSGFLARFLLSCPETTIGNRPFIEPPAHWPALESYHHTVKGLLNIPLPLNEQGILEPRMMSLSPQARTVWVRFYNGVEAAQRAGGQLAGVRDVASKTADNAARLAALFHAYETGLGSMEIGAESMEAGADVALWHLSESLRFFSELALPQTLMDAIRLDAWLLAYCKQENTDMVKKNHAMQYGPLRTKDKLEAALVELEERHRVKLKKEGRANYIQLHPDLVAGA